MMGCDTVYANGLMLVDEGIEKLAEGEGRVVVSRDRMLAARADGILLTKTDIEGQLAELVNNAKEKGIEISIPEEPEKVFCPMCNARLGKTDKTSRRGKIPKKV